MIGELTSTLALINIVFYFLKCFLLDAFASSNQSFTFAFGKPLVIKY